MHIPPERRLLLLAPGVAVEVLEGRTAIARGVVLHRWDGSDDWRSAMPT